MRTKPGETRGRVLRFVRERVLSGAAPTVREVQEAFAFRAVQTAREHLERLVEEGRLTKQPGRARGYGLPESEGRGAVGTIPLLGRVHAGELHEAIEEPEGRVPFEAAGRGSRLPEEDHFALRVEGDSMIGASILPGDVVIVHHGATVKSGDIVVARVTDDTGTAEATVKRLRRRGRRVELHPENPDYEVIVPSPEQSFEIIGKVVEMRRSL